MIFIGLFLAMLSLSLAGTPCPPRENIYPCSCIAISRGKNNFYTSVTCHRLSSTDALNNIFSSLKTMRIDHFYLYDSFWETKDLSNGEDKRVLPADWINSLYIKELEIVDTTLSQCFVVCNAGKKCRNDITTRFTIVNSSSHEQLCTSCNKAAKGDVSWTRCMNKLKQFHFRHGRLTTVKADWFDLPKNSLTEMDLSHNDIVKIENNAFLNLKKLKVLRLSHNSLKDMSWAIGTKLEELEELDVSWNQIKKLNEGFLAGFPKLKTLLMNNNYLVNLVQKEWKNFPEKYLRTIDLTENNIECDCNIRWINSTFPVHTAIQGRCTGPEEFEDILIRTASRYLNERCTEDGKIGTRKRTTKAPVTKAMNDF